MADIMDCETRSRLMSRIRGKDTGPEVLLRRALHRRGVRFRIHGKGIPGRPDIFWKGRKIAVFIHGCFWHGCPTHYVRPTTNASFWRDKLKANEARDQRVRNELSANGWQVIEFWEHEVVDSLEQCADKIMARLNRCS